MVPGALPGPANHESLILTMVIAILSAVIATVIGTAAAIGIHNMKALRRRIVMNITYIPVVNPEIVTGLSLMLLFIFTNFQLGFISLLLSYYL